MRRTRLLLTGQEKGAVVAEAAYQQKNPRNAVRCFHGAGDLRGAQLSYVQALGVEVARHNIQVNAIAQNFVDNETYFPPEVQANPKFQERLKREVPLGRLVSADEDASFVAYLCSDAANCFIGQVFPVCGGWIAR